MSALCTLADVQTYLGVSDANTANVLTALIPTVSASVEAYCNRTFASQAYTETRNGGCGPKLFLSQGPVTAVSSVTVDNLPVTQAPDAASGGFVFDSTTVYIRPGASGPQEFCKGVQNVTVTYTAGFAVIPPDVNLATVLWIASTFAKRTRIDKRSETLGQAQTQGYDLSDMPQTTKRLLSAYIRWSPLA